MNENFQKAQQIMQALQLTEQKVNPNNPSMYISEPVITEEDRAKLVTELVKLLAPSETV